MLLMFALSGVSRWGAQGARTPPKPQRHTIDNFTISESMCGIHVRMVNIISGVLVMPCQHPSPMHFLWRKRSTMGLYRAHTAGHLTRCPNTMNINRKYNLSFTSYKLSCLLKMIIRKATVRQRHLHLTAKIVCSTTKQKSEPFTGLAIKLEVERYCLTCLSVFFEDVFVRSEPSGRLS